MTIDWQWYDFLTASALSLILAGNSGMSPCLTIWIMGCCFLGAETVATAESSSSLPADPGASFLLDLPMIWHIVLTSWPAVVIWGVLGVLEITVKCIPVVDAVYDTWIVRILPIFATCVSLLVYTTTPILTPPADMMENGTEQTYNNTTTIINDNIDCYNATTSMNYTMNATSLDMAPSSKGESNMAQSIGFSALNLVGKLSQDVSMDDTNSTTPSNDHNDRGFYIFLFGLSSVWEIVLIAVGNLLAVLLHAYKLLFRLTVGVPGCITACISFGEVAWIVLTTPMAMFVRPSTLVLAPLLLGMAAYSVQQHGIFVHDNSSDESWKRVLLPWLNSSPYHEVDEGDGDNENPRHQHANIPLGRSEDRYPERPRPAFRFPGQERVEDFWNGAVRRQHGSTVTPEENGKSSRSKTKNRKVPGGHDEEEASPNNSNGQSKSTNKNVVRRTTLLAFDQTIQKNGDGDEQDMPSVSTILSNLLPNDSKENLRQGGSKGNKGYQCIENNR